MRELAKGSIIASNYEMLRLTTPFYHSFLLLRFTTLLSYLSVFFQFAQKRLFPYSYLCIKCPRLYDGRLYGGGLYGGTLPN